MDRYLRYDKNLDGKIPKLYFQCKILNKNKELIGARFVDINHPVYIDIPIDNIYSLTGLSREFIDKDLDRRVDSPSILNFSFFKQFIIILSFNKDYVIPPIYLNDDFSFIGNPPESITSFYMPKCILRYDNKDFAINGKYKLLMAMGIIYDDDFQRAFKPFHMEHFRFIDSNDVTVWMRTRLADKFINDDNFLEKRIVDYCNSYDCKREQLDLRFDKKEELLVLTIHHDADFGPLCYFTPDIVEQGCLDSGKKYRYGFNNKYNKYFIIPDGGYNVFNHRDGRPKSDTLSDDAKAFVLKSSKYCTSLTYHFTCGSQDKMFMYVGISPSMNIPFLEGISDTIDQCIESYDMELLHHIMVGECCNCDIDILCKDKKMMCKMTKEYDADIYSFGVDKGKEVYDKIAAAYKKYFEEMDAEAKYTGRKLFAFSLSVPIPVL